jgi:hypothetical protein
VLDVLANALLAAGHGRVARWVRGALGEQAKLGTLRFVKGALHIDGARLVVGKTKTLLVERATLSGVFGALLGRELAFDAKLRPLETEVGDIQVRGVAVVGRGGGEGRVTITTKTSCVALEGRVAASGGIGGVTARGTLSFHDACELGIFRAAVRPHRTGGLDFDATLGGTLRAPSIAGPVTSAKIALRLGDDPALPTLTFEDVAGRLEVDGQHVAWTDLAGTIYQGRVRTSGVVRLDADPVEVRGSYELTGLRVEEVSTKSDGEPRLASYVRGALGGQGGVDYVAGALSGQAEVRLDDAEFLAVRLAAPSLEAYGLPVPSPTATSPLTARVEYEAGTLHVTNLRASVDGVDVEGVVSATIGGAITGELGVDLREEYLRRSVVLALPALLGARVTVPIVLAGLTAAPAVTFELGRALETLLERNVVGDAVKGALDDLLGRRR